MTTTLDDDLPLTGTTLPDPFDPGTDDEPETETCPACGGTGRYEHNPCGDHHIEVLACSDCDGTGRVPVEEVVS